MKGTDWPPISVICRLISGSWWTKTILKKFCVFLSTSRFHRIVDDIAPNVSRYGSSTYLQNFFSSAAKCIFSKKGLIQPEIALRNIQQMRTYCIPFDSRDLALQKHFLKAWKCSVLRCPASPKVYVCWSTVWKTACFLDLVRNGGRVFEHGDSE